MVPSIREDLLEPGPGAVEFVQELREGRVDAVVYLTQGGVWGLPKLLSPIIPQPQLKRALREVLVVARGHKTARALEQLDLPPQAVSKAPHTWRDMLKALEERVPLAGMRVAVVEHGVIHVPLRAALLDLGAHPLELAVYRWVLPEDEAPLMDAVSRIIAGSLPVVLFTNGAQIDAVMGVAGRAHREERLRSALMKVLVGAVGEVTASRLAAFGLTADVIATEPRMDVLVQEAALACSSVEAGPVEAGPVEAGPVEAGRGEAGRGEAGRGEAGRGEAGRPEPSMVGGVGPRPPPASVPSADGTGDRSSGA